MKRIHGRTRWGRLATIFGAAAVTALQCLAVPAFAGFELPPGERITNLPAIPRNMPQKEAYEVYDPVIGRNFDMKNLWMRADLRVRPEMRNNTCFGAAINASGSCNTFLDLEARAGDMGAKPGTKATISLCNSGSVWASDMISRPT